jgi:uroporphyrinogen-III synthase
VLARLDDFEWIVFTSAHAVEVFGLRRNPAILPRKIAVIGPATARAVEALALPVSLLPPHYVAESLAELLVQQAAGASILIIRAEEARDVLPTMLEQAGCRVSIVEAYRNRIPEESLPMLREVFAAPDRHPDAVTFTSGSTVRNLVVLLASAGLIVPTHIVLASIGPITSQKMREFDLEPTIQAREATLTALVEALIHYFSVDYSG